MGDTPVYDTAHDSYSITVSANEPTARRLQSLGHPVGHSVYYSAKATSIHPYTWVHGTQTDYNNTNQRLYNLTPSMPVIFRTINSRTEAFTFSEVNICYEALGTVMEEKKRDMDDRFMRDEGLVARWSWVGLRRAMDNSKVWWTLAMSM